MKLYHIWCDLNICHIFGMRLQLAPVVPSPLSPCSWVKKFGEHNGLDVLLTILKGCCSANFQGKDAILRKVQHQGVRCLKAFMNNKVGG